MESLHSFGPLAGERASDPRQVTGAGKAGDSTGEREPGESSEGRQAWGRTVTTGPCTPRVAKRHASEMEPGQNTEPQVVMAERKSRSESCTSSSTTPRAPAVARSPAVAELVFEDDAPAPAPEIRLTPEQVAKLVDLAATGDPALGLENLWRGLRRLAWQRCLVRVVDDKGVGLRLSEQDYTDVAWALVDRWGKRDIPPERLDLIGDSLTHRAGLSLMPGVEDNEMTRFLHVVLLKAVPEAVGAAPTITRWLQRAFGPVHADHPAYPFTGRGLVLMLVRCMAFLSNSNQRLAWVLRRSLTPRTDWAGDDARHRWSNADLQVHTAHVRFTLDPTGERVHPALLGWVCGVLLPAESPYTADEAFALASGLTADLPQDGWARARGVRSGLPPLPQGYDPLHGRAGCWPAPSPAGSAVPDNYLGLLRPVLRTPNADNARQALVVLGLSAGREHGILEDWAPCTGDAVEAHVALLRRLCRLPGGLDRLVAQTADLLAGDDIALCQAFVNGLVRWGCPAVPKDHKSSQASMTDEQRALYPMVVAAFHAVGTRWTPEGLTAFGELYVRRARGGRMTSAQMDATVQNLLVLPADAAPHVRATVTELRLALRRGLGAPADRR